MDDSSMHPRSIHPPAMSQRLGEELPIFCEKCGYSLHGLPSCRCEQCTILHFVCPECGHRQPINTLRPAVQKALGRAWAIWLVGSIFVRTAVMLICLLFWFIMGGEWFRARLWSPSGLTEFVQQLSLEMVVGFTCFAVPWAMVCRMFLLVWRPGWLVGVVLASLTCVAIILGAFARVYPHSEQFFELWSFRQAFVQMLIYSWVLIVILCAATWPIWTAIVRIFLPHDTGNSLLEWQRTLSRRRSEPTK